MLDSSKKV